MADAIDKKEELATDIECTCNNDEFYMTVCPVHSKIGLSEDVATEVNDGHLLHSKQVTIKGHLFECPNCNQATLIVNKGYIPKVCCECKKEVIIKSKVFSDFVREENAALSATEIAVGNLL